MQEKFALRKTLKKVAAIGTSLAMVGITVSGALAAGLGDYPTGLGFNNMAGQTVVVYGSLGSDNAAAQDVLSGLPGGSAVVTTATTTTASTASTATSGVQYGVGSLGTQAIGDLFETGSNAQSKEVPIIEKLNATTNFGQTLENEDLAYLKDSSVAISMHDTSDNYDFHEEVRLGGNNNVVNTVQLNTGLTYDSNRNEKFKSNLFLVTPANSLGFYYVFDKSLKAGNYVSNSTTLEPFQIDFLGETISIENTVQSTSSASTTNDADTITLSVGKRAVLSTGESMTVMLAGQTYTVTMTGTTSTGSGKADITVTGPAGSQREVVSQDTSLSFNSVGPRPIQLRVEDVFDEQGTADDRATIIVGTEQSGGTKGAYNARKTYDTGNGYIGEDSDNPIWVWQLGNLTGTNPTIGVRNALNVNSYSETDNALVKHVPYVGDYSCLPNFYVCMVFEKMHESDDNFRWYEVSASDQKDLRTIDGQTSADQSGLSVVTLSAKGTSNQGFVAGGTKASELYIAQNTSMVGVWRRKQDSSEALFVSANFTPAVGLSILNDFATLDYGSTSVALDLLVDNNQAAPQASSSLLQLSGTANIGTALLVVDDPNNATNVNLVYAAAPGLVAGDGATHPFNTTSRHLFTSVLNSGDLAMMFQNSTSTGGFTYLGRSKSDTVVGNELTYKAADGTIEDISSWQEDTRTLDGMVIRDPDANSPGDVLQFGLPADWRNFKSTVTFARPKAGFLSTTGIGGKPVSGVGGTTKTSSVLVKDTEVGDVSMYNAVVVGGPCVNKVAASLLGVTFPACGAQSGLTGPGSATLVLKDNGTKKALLVYGWEADDTARAAVLLKDPTKLREKLSAASKLTADSVNVKGTSMDVAAITVE